MHKNPIRRFFVNLICGIVYGEDRRRQVRVVLNSDIISYRRLIKRDMGQRIKSMHIKTGSRASNLIMVVNDKYVYKFPYRRQNYQKMIEREIRITKCFKRYCNIPIPSMRVIKTSRISVRRYPLIKGLPFNEFSPDVIMPHIREYGKIIGRFLYEIGCIDADEISDLKTCDARGRPTQVELTPGFMRGWYHGDIAENFLINPDTMKIVAIIDWEDACFTDFSHVFNVTNPGPYCDMMKIAHAEYIRLYRKNKNHRTGD